MNDIENAPASKMYACKIMHKTIIAVDSLLVYTVVENE